MNFAGLSRAPLPDPTADGHLKSRQGGRKPGRPSVGVEIDAVHLDAARPAAEAQDPVTGEQGLEDLSESEPTLAGANAALPVV